VAGTAYAARPVDGSLDARARQSLGTSQDAIYRTVQRLLEERGAAGLLVDVGCGTGNLWRTLAPAFHACIGVDAVRYEGLPDGIDVKIANLDCDPLPVADGRADVAASVETIEHLENPRALFRELVRVTRPGGWVVVTTPNQLSVLSLLTLIVKQRFSAFQDSLYPAHRTALLEVDLRRMAHECGLVDVTVQYTASGRMPLTGGHYPGVLARRWPRLLSDNVALIGRKSAGPLKNAAREF
jgi:2-polyprenyl-3-methyl-5-hydroxy-6-metoxy-1,4-benzoquinol methylase